MKVGFDVRVDVPVPLRLGVYRIVEQCLLNAAMHGGAPHCEVAISGDPAGIIITVSDDGSGLVPGAATGFGTTLIDTWCRVLGAKWTRQPGARGVCVVITIPPSSHM